MGKRLLLLGGGHAHMTVMHDIPEFLSRGHDVTVVGPSAFHYYSGMGPGMLGGTYDPDDIRFCVRDQVQGRGGRFVTDRALRIDAHKQIVHLASGEKLLYDVLSCNTGSYVPSAALGEPGEDIFSVKPIENLLKGRQRVKELLLVKDARIGVVGGGPAGLEVAGNLWGLAQRLGARKPQIQIFAGKHFLGSRPEKVRSLARKSLRSRGIEIIEQGYARNVRSGCVELEDGSSWDMDIIFMAVGVKPSSLFADSGLPVGRDGGLLVTDRLHSVDYANIFGGGDCISFAPYPLDKVGVYAVRENPVLKHNLMAALEGGEMIPFDPGKE
ncbi:MAG: FAD-dependent oxidoreductase, partial [Desulfoplanes sp.]|nr:FAD-dependent oxidoreductase [Desulfoplanes sp.]